MVMLDSQHNKQKRICTQIGAECKLLKERLRVRGPGGWPIRPKKILIEGKGRNQILTWGVGENKEPDFTNDDQHREWGFS